MVESCWGEVGGLLPFTPERGFSRPVWGRPRRFWALAQRGGGQRGGGRDVQWEIWSLDESEERGVVGLVGGHILEGLGWCLLAFGGGIRMSRT